MTLKWNANATSSDLHGMLRALAGEYGLEECTANANVIFEEAPQKDALIVTRRAEETFVIQYGRKDLVGRGIARVLAGQEGSEVIPFTAFGVLLDCTRGNVYTVEAFKRYVRRLSLLGYNQIYLYVKDAYELPDEPYFGYMRGAYTKEEIRAMDEYAQLFHIEMRASIQTLGHVEPSLRWPAYAEISDTPDVMMVGHEKTYELIRKMLTFWSEALSSRRIHLGMDETQSLGRGRYLTEHGYENPFDLYTRHLQKVCSICTELGLEPMIWHDMLFHYGLEQVDGHSVIPQKVREAVPSGVQISYWDYYTRAKEDDSLAVKTYEDGLKFCREFNGCEPVMASGIWTWVRTWTDYEQSFATIRPCIKGCKRAAVKEIIFTLWGDDGGYCDFDSAFAGLAWTADYCFNDEQENGDRTARLFEAVFGTSYTLQLICGNLTYTYKDKDEKAIKILPGPILWDDPLMAMVFHQFPAYKRGLLETLLTGYKNILSTLEEHRCDQNAGHLNYAWNVANVLIQKLELRQRLLIAYAKRDYNTLELINERYIPDVLDAIDGLLEAFRVQWKRNFKSFGMELMQIRLGGLSERYRELGRTLDELVHGQIDSIGELEVMIKPGCFIPHQYYRVATSGFFI